MSSLPSELTAIDSRVDVAPEPGAIAMIRGFVSQWWIAFMASSIFVVSGHLLIKAGLNAAAYHISGATGPTTMLHTVLQPAVMIGLATYCLGSVCWIIAVAQQEISF